MHKPGSSSSATTGIWTNSSRFQRWWLDGLMHWPMLLDTNCVYTSTTTVIQCIRSCQVPVTEWRIVHCQHVSFQRYTVLLFHYFLCFFMILFMKLLIKMLNFIWLLMMLRRFDYFLCFFYAFCDIIDQIIDSNINFYLIINDVNKIWLFLCFFMHRLWYYLIKLLIQILIFIYLIIFYVFFNDIIDQIINSNINFYLIINWIWIDLFEKVECNEWKKKDMCCKTMGSMQSEDETLIGTLLAGTLLGRQQHNQLGNNRNNGTVKLRET